MRVYYFISTRIVLTALLIATVNYKGSQKEPRNLDDDDFHAGKGGQNRGQNR